MRSEWRWWIDLVRECFANLDRQWRCDSQEALEGRVVCTRRNARDANDVAPHKCVLHVAIENHLHALIARRELAQLGYDLDK
jgi:hypothetical protein